MSGTPFWVWVALAFGIAAAWGFVVVFNKRVLQYVDPFALNLIMRVPTIVLVALVGTLLTVTGAWDLGFGMSWPAFGYITISAVVTWLIAFNTYYLVLRMGAVGVVTPIMATDPLFTAVFAVLLLGSGLGSLVITGLVVSTLGIVLLSRWMGAGGTPAEPPVVADSVPPLTVLDREATGRRDAAAPDPAGPAPRPPAAAGVAAKTASRVRLEVMVLAVVTAAGWGLGPVVVEMAFRSLGGASVTMMVQSQTMGLLMLVPIVVRRRRILVRRLTRTERRLVIRLVLVTSVLETFFALAYYVLIDEIGAVLTVLIAASAPVFAILGGIWLLHERYSWKLAVGGAVTLAGVAIATLQGM